MVTTGPQEVATSLDIVERGQGRPLLFLNAGIGLDPGYVVLDLLGKYFHVIAPSHPGFANSERPKSITTVDHLSYFYLDFLDQRDLRDVVLVGVSTGAWIAAEMAIKSSARISHLVMANAVGIKVGDRETRDIADIFAMTEDQFNEAAFADPLVGKKDYQAMSDADVLIVARNREPLARLTWSPYMHNPKLKGRLQRIRVPTLFLWGAQDRILSEQYGRSYCKAVPGAHFDMIDGAGHLPNIEQPAVFATKIAGFVDGVTTQ